MKVLVDTSVWSQAFRRKPGSVDDMATGELKRLIADYRVLMIGPVRQELLSGIRTLEQYEALRDRLRAFPDAQLHSDDYEVAAEYFNQCRSKGIQGSSTDFLICAVAALRDAAVYSTDRDFERYTRVLGVSRHRSGA